MRTEAPRAVNVRWGRHSSCVSFRQSSQHRPSGRSADRRRQPGCTSGGFGEPRACSAAPRARRQREHVEDAHGDERTRHAGCARTSRLPPLVASAALLLDGCRRGYRQVAQCTTSGTGPALLTRHTSKVHDAPLRGAPDAALRSSSRHRLSLRTRILPSHSNCRFAAERESKLRSRSDQNPWLGRWMRLPSLGSCIGLSFYGCGVSLQRSIEGEVLDSFPLFSNPIHFGSVCARRRGFL